VHVSVYVNGVIQCGYFEHMQQYSILWLCHCSWTSYSETCWCALC